MSTSPVGGGLKPGSRKEKEEASAKESLQRVGAASKLKGAAKKMMVVGTLTSTPDTVRTSVAVVRKKDEVVVHKKGWRGSPVHYAAAAGRLDLLIPLWKDDVEHEIDINKGYGENLEEPPLHLACRGGHMGCVQYLLETCVADIYAVNRFYENCLFAACDAGQLEVANYLLDFVRRRPLLTWKEAEKKEKKRLAREKKRNDQLDAGIPESELVLEAEEEEPDWLEKDEDTAEDKFMDQCSKDGSTALMLACKRGYTEIVKFLLARGAPPNALNRNGESALSIALLHKKNRGVIVTPAIEAASRAATSDIAMLLLQGGADKELRTGPNGWTPLMYAVNGGDLQTVKSLVARQCNVNVEGKAGGTPLSLARARLKGRGEDGENGPDAKIVEVLIAGGALDKEALAVAKIQWAKDEEERRNRPQTAEDRPTTSEQRRKQEAKIKVL